MNLCASGAHRCNEEKPIQAFYDDAFLDIPIACPSLKTYLSLFNACIKRKSLGQARHLHAHLTHYGFSCDGLLGSFLVVAFAKCGAIHDALYVSCSLPQRTVFSWAAIICAYVECGNWLEALDKMRCMQDDGFSPNAIIYANALKACGSMVDLAQGRTLHTEALKRGFTSEFFVGNTLVSMYGKCGAVEDAEAVFSALPERNVVSWTVMLAGYVEQSQGRQALHVYRQMLEEGANPNILTVGFALKACNILADTENYSFIQGEVSITKILEIGCALHAFALKKGFACNVVIGTTLLCLYSKCGAITEAENAFKALLLRDIVTWNSMLLAYKNQSHEEQGFLFYRHMQEEGVTPSQHTFVMLLEACGNMAKKDQSYVAMALDIGWGLHCDIKRIGYMSDVLVGSALLTMYVKCGAVLDAEKVFNALPLRNIVTWTAMLSACIEQGEAEKALTLYSRMQKEDITFDNIIYLAILQSCGEVGCLDLYMEVHTTIVSVGYDKVPFVRASLVHGYGRCASMLNGHAILAHLAEPTLESWNACIVGHSAIGNFLACMRAYEELRMAGLNPDEVTYAAVLSVCSHSGSIVENFHYLTSMSKDHGLAPDVKHYASTADLLGRAGFVKEAFAWLKQMPKQADTVAWSSLLGACRIHGDIELAKEAFEYAVRVRPNQADAYILLSNMCVLDSDEHID